MRAWPSRWLTPIRGIFNPRAIPFAVVNPTIKPPINPGPDVAATPSISSIFKQASSSAWSINGLKVSTWDLDAISGTTPPMESVHQFG